MVYEDVVVDVNGIPEKIPNLFYQRLPILKTEPGTFLDWKRRKGNVHRLLEGTEFEITRLKKDIEKFDWEKKLEKRQRPTESDFEFNQKIINILSGRHFLGIESSRIELRDRAITAGR